MPKQHRAPGKHKNRYNHCRQRQPDVSVGAGNEKRYGIGDILAGAHRAVDASRKQRAKLPLLKLAGAVMPYLILKK